MNKNFDVRLLTKEELVEHVVANKSRSWLLEKQSNDEVRAWAEGKDREFLLELCAGWGKDALINAGLRNR